VFETLGAASKALIHKKSYNLSVCLVNEVSQPGRTIAGNIEQVLVFRAQVCQIWARAIHKQMLFILHTVSITLVANYELVRDPLLFMPKNLNMRAWEGLPEAGEGPYRDADEEGPCRRSYPGKRQAPLP